MKKKLLMLIFPIVLITPGLTSCHEEEPELKYLLESNVIAGVFGWCCEKPGNTCERPNRGIVPTLTFRTYVEQDNLSGYFQNENWQSEFPELTDEPEIVNYIITNNPKGVIVQNDIFLLLKDKTKGLETENIKYAIVLAGDKNCKEYLSL